MAIHIEKPCNENWNNMQSCCGGKFCSACGKNVIDFTRKNGDEIIASLKNNNGGEICGRFKTIQLKPSFYSKNRFRKWLLTTFTFIFSIGLLSSCWRHAQGCAAYMKEPSPDKKHNKEIKSDSLSGNHFQK